MKAYAEQEREKAFTYGYAEGFSDNPLNDVEIKLEEYKQQNPLT